MKYVKKFTARAEAKREEEIKREAGRRRYRYFQIRNVARKEIADLVRLAKTLPEDQFKQIFNVESVKPQPYPEIKDLMEDKSLSDDEYVKKVQERIVKSQPESLDDLAELFFALLRKPIFDKADRT